MSDEIQDTVKYYADLSRKNPDDLDTLINLAWSYDRAGDFPQAIERFRQALAMNEGNVHVHYGLALALLGSGQTADALQEFRAAYDLVARSEDQAEKAILSKQIEAYLRRLEATG
jgi:tetratricopeptide (TPR) repeat protein